MSGAAEPTDWTCVACGAAAPDRVRSCSCTTNVLLSKSAKVTAWKDGAPQAGTPITVDHQIACLRREIALRKNVYPSWVKQKRMKPDKAKEEIDAMQAAHDTLMAVKEGRLVDAASGPLVDAIKAAIAERRQMASACDEMESGDAFAWNTQADLLEMLLAGEKGDAG